MDVVDVTVTLTPARYQWAFGDTGLADFPDDRGIGLPYSPDLRCCASQVAHNYLQSSLRVFDQGGFPVHLTATWTTSAHLHATRDRAPATGAARRHRGSGSNGGRRPDRSASPERTCSHRSGDGGGHRRRIRYGRSGCGPRAAAGAHQRPAGAIASLLGQAYLAVYQEQLTTDQRRDATDRVSVAGTRHGRTSTTLVISAPVPARPYLVRHMRAAAERAFGEHVDVDGLVSHDRDVLVRVTWDSRHPVAPRLLELVGPGAGPSLWPAPCLVSLLMLYDRQEYDLNWWSLSNVLIASPAGQGADIPLTALAASLASVRRPEDLGLLVLARPHMLPEELGRMPHGLVDPVDSSDAVAVRAALGSVRHELDRRIAAVGGDDQDLVVIVHELADLESEAFEELGAIAAAGPRHRVRVVAATDRPVAALLELCPSCSSSARGWYSRPKTRRRAWR
jgi:hypothetical protein